ncbi:hypothetical protein PR048_008748 [Dryococelus australis]|uniref:Mutator-like transposase domain-containing protein n=1 Tax=Dryococelus australis TaxID=614101 RepID=A0ABQ9HY17_9NEOP|nr:hypothetical protein PR048_008748 [Dryococelus australis]
MHVHLLFPWVSQVGSSGGKQTLGLTLKLESSCCGISFAVKLKTVILCSRTDKCSSKVDNRAHCTALQQAAVWNIVPGRSQCCRLFCLSSVADCGACKRWLLECNICHREYTIHNEGIGYGDINSAGAWAALTSGIDVPVMSMNIIKKEVEVEKLWTDHIDKAIVDAGVEKKRLALEKGDVDDDGVPFVTVIVDGGWNKRSYGYNYNANSVIISAMIIGEETGKLLFVGVRNKYCCLCDKAMQKDGEVKPQTCYKSWD